MFDVGFWELAILFGLGLIILGPERMPKVAMQLGSWIGRARRMARQLSDQFREEMVENEIKNPFSPTSADKKTTNYSRPGVDDLKPATAADESSTHETSGDHSPGTTDNAARDAD